MREISCFLNAINDFGYVSYYRGHGDASWVLLPSIARLESSNINKYRFVNWHVLELYMMREFEKHGCSLLSSAPKNELEWSGIQIKSATLMDEWREVANC